MSNVNNNRLDQIMDQAALDKIDQAVDLLLSALPKASLTDEERNSMVSMDVDNKVFADNVLIEAQGSARTILPAFIDITTFKNDLVLAEQADAIASKIAEITRRTSDIHRIASSETMATASLIYNLIKAANKAGVSGAKEPFEKLKKRYEQTRRDKEPDA
jgi:hypothetical protein